MFVASFSWSFPFLWRSTFSSLPSPLSRVKTSPTSTTTSNETIIPRWMSHRIQGDGMDICHQRCELSITHSKRIFPQREREPRHLFPLPRSEHPVDSNNQPIHHRIADHRHQPRL